MNHGEHGDQCESKQLGITMAGGDAKSALVATAGVLLPVGFFMPTGQIHDELDGEFIVATNGAMAPPPPKEKPMANHGGRAKNARSLWLPNVIQFLLPVFPVVTVLSDISLPELLSQIVTGAPAESHDRPGGILARGVNMAASIDNKEILDIV